MPSVSIGDIAVLLKQDEGLMSDWRAFYHHLNLQNNNIYGLTQIYTYSNFNPFTLMSAILNQWVTEKSLAATVTGLADVLKAMNRNNIKDILLKTFEPESKVESINYNLNANTAAFTMTPSTTEDRLLQQKPPGGVTILRLSNRKQDGQGRVLIFLNHLLSILSKIGDRPVAVISINGKQRSGKSFLANQFIKYLKYYKQGESWLDVHLESCFEWRDGYESVTSGIQVWFEPLFVEIDGKEIGVIVIDTQGYHGKHTGTQEDSIIFGLSVLLSSVFIYNERQIFSEDSSQFLRLYLEFAKFASARSDDGAKGLVFQKLIILLRDFEAVRQFSYGYYDKSSCPPNQKENLKLFIFKQTENIHNEAIETRLGIESFFQDIGVYAMSGPGKQMPHLPQYQSSSAWDTEFRSSIIDFVTKFFSPESILNSTRKLFGQEQTGDQLKKYVSMWAEQILKPEGMVESKTIFKLTVDMFYRNKIETAFYEYHTLMTNHLDDNSGGITEEAFNRYHELVITCIECKFCKNETLVGGSLVNKYKTQLREMINGVKHDYVLKNHEKVAAEQKRRDSEEVRIAAAAAQWEVFVETQRLNADLKRQVSELKLENERVEQENQLR